MHRSISKKLITLIGILFTAIGMLGVNQVLPANHVEATLELKGGHWPSRTVTYSINPGTEATVASAWINAANEINRYGIINFVQTSNGAVKLGQQVASNQSELGVTQTWRRGNEYSRAVAYLSVNQSLKNSQGNNYYQRQYPTALHELGHVIGLKHDTNPAGLMYSASGASFSTIDSTFLNAMIQIYGASTTGYVGYAAQSNASNGNTQQAAPNSGTATRTTDNVVPTQQTTATKALVNAKQLEVRITNLLEELTQFFNAHRAEYQSSLASHDKIQMTRAN